MMIDRVRVGQSGASCFAEAKEGLIGCQMLCP